MIDWKDKSWINFVDEKVWQNLPDTSLKSRNNSEITFRCPICGDSKKNKLKKRGYFYRKTGTFHCFNCEANLTGYDFLKVLCPKDVFDAIIQEYKVLNFDNIVRGRKRELSEDSVSSQRSFDILSPNPSYKYLLDANWFVSELSETATKYLDGRKIPIDSRGMLKSIKDSIGREFLLIQYIWDESVCYHQLHNFNGYDISGQGNIKYVFPKDEHVNFQPKPVFNIENVDVSFPYIYCTEGVYDSLFLYNGVSLGGKVVTDFQLKMIRYRFPRHKIVLALDNDKPGIKAALNCAETHPDFMFLDNYKLLGAAKTKDINDFVCVSNRPDIFMNKDLLVKMTISSFLLKMNLKLN